MTLAEVLLSVDSVIGEVVQHLIDERKWVQGRNCYGVESSVVNTEPERAGEHFDEQDGRTSLGGGVVE